MARAERYFASAILLAFLAVDATMVAVAVSAWSSMVPDFFGFWSTARFLQTHPAADAYDVALLGPFQHVLRPDFAAIFPAPYSPVFLLLIRPLAWMSYSWAHLAWVTATLLGFVVASRRLLGHPGWCAALLVAPVIVLNAVYGQTGFLSAALMIAVLLLMPGRPWLAGFCLALLSFKPQLGLLMPVVLLARRDRATLIATIVWLGALVVLSGASLGWSIWPDWLSAIAAHGRLIEGSREQLIGIMGTVTSMVLSLGGSLTLARAVQALAAIGVAAIVWIGWRRTDREMAMAATLVGTFLATPYAFVYDTPAAMCGAILYLRACRQSGLGMSTLDLAAVVFALIAPLFILAAPPQPPAAPAALMALFILIAWRILRPAGPRSTTGTSPSPTDVRKRV